MPDGLRAWRSVRRLPGADPFLLQPCVVLPSAAAGKVRVANADGRILSVQPDQREEDREPDKDGGYEQATLCGDKLVYDYDGLFAPVTYLVLLPSGS